MPQHPRVSLKRKAPENKNDVFVSEEPGKDFFPLSLFVSGPEVEKLGLSGMEIGEEHELVADVKVTSVSVRDSEDGGKEESVGLTLTAGVVNSAHGGSDEERAKKIFDGK